MKLITVFYFMLIASVQGVAQEQASINFRDAEISSLIETVAEITGRSFVVDPRVRGRVTIIAPEAIDADLLYQAFLSALQVQGFQAVEDGAVVRIVPFNQAFGTFGGGANELETRLIKVRYVSAESLVPVIRPLLSASARLQAFGGSNYLVVTDIKSNVDALVVLVNEMDDSSQMAIEVIDLEYIAPGEAVYIVEQLQQINAQGLSVVEDSLNNRLIITGPEAARAAFKDMLRILDVPTTRKTGVEVIYLDYARAIDLQPIIEGLLQSAVFLQMAGDSAEDVGYRVEVDESNNALVVAASPGAIREIQNVLQKLDRLKPQILIEVVIAELSEDQARRLSTQLVYTDQDTGGTLTKFDNLLTTLLGVGAGLGQGDLSDLGVLDQLQGAAIGGGNFDSDTGLGFGVLVQALKTDSSTRVLSTPSIVTLNNEEASLSIGAEIPFLTGSFTTNGEGSNNPFQTISREDVGIKLTVLPQISEGDVVRLSLEQESSNVLGSSSQLGTADVVTSKSTIITNVQVANGDLLILGGLMDNQYENTEARVPVLGSIPFLGALFRSSSKSDDQSVLMMFIRPTILRTTEQSREISDSRFDYLIGHDLNEEGDSVLTPLLEGLVE
ncbi:type II secretion system secretin GspD [Gammaproteobacteria bacterium]|nr:type II secretion system secretin GspD [Gammaproteobacteria bacterium]